MPTRTIFTSCFCLRSLVLVFIAFFSPNLKAQLCTGSLGDPVVNITFGSGSGPSSYVPSNSYSYFPLPCPDDGFYTVTGQTSGCFGNSWHTVSTDHTGGGSFMLVNASYSPGDFFVTTVTDLCPNTTYEFAAWIMNVMIPTGSIRPDITFSIETPAGQILNSFNTGDINVTAVPQWKQYGFFFKTPPNNAVIVLRMTNKAPGGNGNDLALDDITFRPCGAKISASIQGNSTDTIDVCTGNTNVYQFNAKIPAGAYQQPVYQWQVSTDKGISWKDIAGANALTYTRQPTGDGSYWYRLTVVEKSFVGLLSCRIASNLLIVNIHSNPFTDAGPDRIILGGNPIILNGNVEGEQVTHVWSPGTYMNDINELKPEVSPPTDMVYTLHAQSVYGCANQDQVSVKVVEGIYVPNAFTPNGDGKNDNWQIPFLDPSFGAEVSVFNRWGQLVYYASATKISWDGKFNGTLQAPGVYVYVITFKQGTIKNMKGALTLVR